MSASPKVIIIGAGPAGLAAAYRLVQGGAHVTVIEAGAQPGGMSRSLKLWGQTVDCGPHRFFSNDKIVNDFFKEVVGTDYVNVSRLTRIFYRKRFFHYPLKVTNVLTNLPPTTVLSVLWSYFLQQLDPIKNPVTFEDWVVSRFGRKLFNMFFKVYSEKLWGIPTAQLDAEWAAQRIKKFSLGEAVKTALFGGDKKKHKTLVDEFAYPVNGTGELYQKQADFVATHGGTVMYNTRVQRVLLDGKNEACGVELADGTVLNADKVISTMPLTLMVKNLPNVPAHVIEACNALYFRNTILVYAEVDALDLFPDNWIYIHDSDVKHGRITNFRNWSPALYGDKKTTILCLEYWCFDNDPIWKEDDAYFGQLAEKELRQTKLIKPEHKVLNTAVVRVPRCYPVYETGYMQHVDVVKNYLETIANLRVIGRYGSFKYNNQDHSILMGLLAAREILTGKKENLWSINTDTEYHESGESLTESDI